MGHGTCSCCDELATIKADLESHKAASVGELYTRLRDGQKQMCERAERAEASALDWQQRFESDMDGDIAEQLAERDGLESERDHYRVAAAKERDRAERAEAEAADLRRRLVGHECAGGPNECGSCCTCLDMQAHYALDCARDELKKTTAEAAAALSVLREIANGPREVSGWQRWAENARRDASDAVFASNSGKAGKALLAEVERLREQERFLAERIHGKKPGEGLVGEIEKLERKASCGKWATSERCGDCFMCRIAALERELERHRHGQTIEGDSVCPDSLRLHELEGEYDSSKQWIDTWIARCLKAEADRDAQKARAEGLQTDYVRLAKSTTERMAALEAALRELKECDCDKYMRKIIDRALLSAPATPLADDYSTDAKLDTAKRRIDVLEDALDAALEVKP